MPSTCPIKLYYLITEAEERNTNNFLMRKRCGDGSKTNRPFTDLCKLLRSHFHSEEPKRNDINNGQNGPHGDSLNPLLFIMVINVILQKSLPEVGHNFDGLHLGSNAYANDLVSQTSFKAPRKVRSCKVRFFTQPGCPLT